MLRVAWYGRYSTDRQSERSTDDQRSLAEETSLRSLGVGVSPHLAFVDDGESGSGSDRPGYQALLRAIESRSVDVLVLDDLARLSREAGDAMNFGRMAEFRGIRIITCDGYDTQQAGSRATLGMKAIFNEQFIETVRHTTKRGMRGRALAGMATGGLAYGFISEPEPGIEGRSGGFRILIHEEEARVVRRAFKLYDDGWSPARIAGLFNDDKIPSPREGRKYTRRGWGDTTIRSWLHNQRYVGIWEWGRREWRKVPGTNTRRPRVRPGGIVQTEQPHLRIIDEQTWISVQARLASVRERYTRNSDGSPKGRAIPGNVATQPLSGILYCGLCDAPMVINGGTQHKRYACSHARQRRTCDNRATVRVADAEKAILDGLQERFTSSEAMAHIRERVASRQTSLTSDVEAELNQHRARLHQAESRARRTFDMMADGHGGTTATTALKEYEREAADASARIAGLEARKRAPVVVPSDQEIVEHFLTLRRTFVSDPVRGRDALRQLFNGGLRLTPETDGVYRARGELSWLSFLITTGARNTKPPADESGRVSVPIDGGGCGGRI